MRLLNKIAVGASAFAFAAALSAGVNTASADAASLKNNITIDYAKSQLKVNSDDKKVIVSYPTVDKKNVLSADKNVCTYDSSGIVIVDLSTLNTTKDNYIKVVGNKNDEPVIIKIKAADQLGKAKTSATNGAISVPKKGETANYATSKLQYATTTSNWASMPETFEPMLQLGATVRVRVTPSETGNLANATTKTVADKAKVEYTVYEAAGTLPGKEIKVKIAKMANAPKVKVDYAKRTITVPAKSEYRINESNGLGNWVDSANKTVLDGTKITLTADGAIDVRTKATDKKPASKYAAVSWKAIYKIGVKAASDGKTASLVTSGAAVSDPDVTVTGGAVNVGYAVTNSVMNGTKVKTATSAAVTIKNESKIYAYQYVIVDKGAEVKLDTKGVKTLKTEKEVKITVKDSKTFKDKEIYVRRAAVTKGNTQWVTDWAKAATITNKAGTVTLG